ncbi:MAG: phosphatase PAP2 family protein [Lachnospiraceae bacterium]
MNTHSAHALVWKDVICRKFRTAFPMLVFMASYLAVFFMIESWNRLHFTVIHMAADDVIPFCEVFILPYLAWFFYVSLYTVYLLITDEENYHKTATYLAIGMGVFLFISIVFPNIHFLRPEVMPRQNIFTDLVQIIYSNDTPTNLTPSIHVYNSIAIMIAVLHTNTAFMKRSVIVKGLLLLQGVLIILSTMFIKQHSVSDVLVAFALSAMVYILVYRLDFVFTPVRLSRKPRRRAVGRI